MPKSRESGLNGVLERGISGSDETCEHYPCHFNGQDCTWCFCPFYPCLDGLTGGKFVIGKKTGKKVWSCINCRWIHNIKVSEEALKRIKSLKNRKMTRLKKLRLAMLEGEK